MKKCKTNLISNIKLGFTLAEVLVTLVVLGLVAALTVPTALQHTGRQEFVSKLRKAQSTLSQSVIKIATMEGYPVGDFTFMEYDDFFDYFAETINTNKICSQNAQGCFSNGTKSLNHSPWANYNLENSLITMDGVAYGWDYGLCSGKGITEEDEYNCIGRFIVDVNGEKSPNMFGLDVFFFVVVNDKGIVPAGDGNNSADCKRTDSGITCAAKVLKEGRIYY